MRILFITDNFPPEVNAPATRTFEHCRQWVAEGDSVTVITCAPNFPQGKVYSGYRNRLFQRENVDGIEVIRVWSYMTRNEGFVRRILDYASFSLSAFIVGLFRCCDVIIATSPQFFTTATACMLSWVKRKPWVFELRDLWPESIVAVGAMRRGRLIAWLERLELFMYCRADLIVPVTSAFRENLIGRGVDAKKIVVVPNGVNLTQFYPRPKDRDLLGDLALQDRFVIVYVGTHGMAHGLEFVITVMAAIEEPDVVCLLVGDGANKARLRDLAGQRAVRNVLFLDPVPKAEVPSYLSIADVALVNLRKSETFKAVIPSKIFEAAAMRVPVLLGVDGQAREIVEEFGAGVYFEPEDREDFLRQLRRLRGDRVFYESLQEGAARLAAAYDRRKPAGEMRIALERLRASV